MKLIDNKKAHDLGGQGLIDCHIKKVFKMTLSSLNQKTAKPNTQPLVIGNFSIRQDEEGRYCLNDLHKASGDQRKDRPSYFIENEKTQELISVIEAEYYDVGNPTSSKKAINIIRGKGREQGTYAVKELIYSYAMWISAKFHLTVIRAYDAMVMQWKLNDRQSISPEQQAVLHAIVDRRSNGNRKTYAEMWSRHNRHFGIPRYAELLEIHFNDAISYLETMELKAKPDQETHALPYPPELIHIAQQINHEYGQGVYKNWFVSIRDNGVIGVQPLGSGYYPINVAEFTKRFDHILDYMYGSDLLRLGRHLQNK